MDTNKQSHSQSRKNNMHLFNKSPSRLQHTTYTTNRQHQTSHGHQLQLFQGFRPTRGCCMPSEKTYGMNGATPHFRSFHRTASSNTGGLSRCCCCSPFSPCSFQSVSLASRKLSSRTASVGLLHKSDGIIVVG